MHATASPLDSIGLGPTVYAGMSQLASAVLTGRNTKQEGYAVFGHLNLGRSKWSVFGTYQLFKPNTNAPDDPFDFRRIVAGVSFTANKNVRLAVDSQKTLYTHDQFTYPASSIVLFSPNLALSNPLGIPNAVPPSVQAVLREHGVHLLTIDRRTRPLKQERRLTDRRFFFARCCRFRRLQVHDTAAAPGWLILLVSAFDYSCEDPRGSGGLATRAVSGYSTRENARISQQSGAAAEWVCDRLSRFQAK